MNIYIVIWSDRHCNPTAHPFISFEKAKEWAKKQAIDSTKYPEDIKEHNYDGFEYYIEYSCEGDNLSISKHTLNVDFIEKKDMMV